jgi:mannose-6-phosphate isomerase-like protein (cupin superfamily)
MAKAASRLTTGVGQRSGMSPEDPAWIIRSVYVEHLAGRALGSSGDDFVIVQWTAEVGDHWIAPLHLHRRDDEAWYVLSGMLGFRLGDDEIEASPGSAVFARRGTPHTFWNAGQSEAEYLLVMTPRIAQLVEQVHEPGADVATIFASHDSEILLQG